VYIPDRIYAIENVKYRNWAMLLNANEDEPVAGSSALANVGEKRCTNRLANGNCTFQNQLYNSNYASYTPLDISSNEATVSSIWDLTSTPMQWHIDPSDREGNYVISDRDGYRWSPSSAHLETPVELDRFKHDDCRRSNFIHEGVEIGTNLRADDVPMRISLPKIEYKPMTPAGANFTGHKDYLTKLMAYFSIEPGGPLRKTYRQQGRWNEAEKLDWGKRLLGAEHPDTLTSMANLTATHPREYFP